MGLRRLHALVLKPDFVEKGHSYPVDCSLFPVIAPFTAEAEPGHCSYYFYCMWKGKKWHFSLIQQNNSGSVESTNTDKSIGTIPVFADVEQFEILEVHIEWPFSIPHISTYLIAMTIAAYSNCLTQVSVPSSNFSLDKLKNWQWNRQKLLLNPFAHVWTGWWKTLTTSYVPDNVCYNKSSSHTSMLLARWRSDREMFLLCKVQ